VSDGILRALLLAAALGSGLAAGIFFAFSTFVMRALGRIPPAQGIAAMQSINVAVINPLFMAVFLGTGVLSLVLAVDAFLRWERPGSALVLAGSALYLVGSIGVTMAFNVPRNDALAAVDAASSEGAVLWAAYLSGWTAWNHVRTVASLVAAALFTLALK
jgi:uncharacterized membrane protein